MSKRCFGSGGRWPCGSTGMYSRRWAVDGARTPTPRRSRNSCDSTRTANPSSEVSGGVWKPQTKSWPHRSRDSRSSRRSTGRSCMTTWNCWQSADGSRSGFRRFIADGQTSRRTTSGIGPASPHKAGQGGLPMPRDGALGPSGGVPHGAARAVIGKRNKACVAFPTHDRRSDCAVQRTGSEKDSGPSAVWGGCTANSTLRRAIPLHGR